VHISVPDPEVFRPPGSGSVSQRYGSGSFHHQAKIAVLRIRNIYPGSRILIFYPSRIPDPKTSTKERGEKKFAVIPIFVATKITKL
jgi:hypothetical protein